MENVSYTAFRSQLARMLDKVNEDHAPLMVTRRKGQEAVVMSLDDFHSYEETAHLMASPRNAERLNRSIAEAENGDAEAHDLIEP